MSTALAPASTTPKVSALAVMASRLNVEPGKLHSTLKSTVFKGASDDELLALVVVANEYKLNPLTKEIYAFPAKGGGIVPVVSVDGWVSMVNDHPQMDGMDFEVHHDGEGKLHSVTCIIYRKDRSRPIRVTELLSECRRNTEPWKMENRMLRHKALMQCARYAFGFSGITDEEEAIDHGIRDVTPPQERPRRSAPAESLESAFGGTASAEPAEAEVLEETPAPTEEPANTEEFIPAEAVEQINEVIHEAEITRATFEAKCRKAKLLTASESVGVNLKPAKLRLIRDNAKAIIDGTYNAGGEQ